MATCFWCEFMDFMFSKAFGNVNEFNLTNRNILIFDK